MANDHLNVLRISGPTAEVDEIVAQAAAGVDPPLSFDTLAPVPAGSDEVATWGTGTAGGGVEPPVRFEERGMSVATYTFSTRGKAPFALASNLAEARPGVVLCLASVEPAGRFGEIRVYSGRSEWSYEMPDDEMDGLVNDESGYPDEEAVLDSLDSTASSVVDDYERALQAAPAP